MEKIKVLIQLIAIITVGAGITYEVVAGAHVGYILITVGALVFAISTKIKS